MKENKTPLTDEQRKLVEGNINLIHWFIHKYKLRQEFLSHVTLGLCMAARNYDPALGSFSTIAQSYMWREVNREFEHKKRQCRDNPAGDDLSLETVIMRDDGAVVTLGDILPDPCDIEQDAENRETLRAVESRLRELPERNRQILLLRWAGYNSTEIGAIVGCSRQNAWEIIKTWEKRVLEGLYD